MGWEVVLHSLMLGPSAPGPGPLGTIPWGGGSRPEDGTIYTNGRIRRKPWMPSTSRSSSKASLCLLEIRVHRGVDSLLISLHPVSQLAGTECHLLGQGVLHISLLTQRANASISWTAWDTHASTRGPFSDKHKQIPRPFRQLRELGERFVQLPSSSNAS